MTDGRRRLGLLMFDLDGTLIESLEVKDAGFATIYAGEARLPEIMDYHKQHNHVVRFDKFRHISDAILGRPLTTAEDARLRAAFSEAVIDGLISCPEVTGARNLLNTYWNAVPMVLISRSPDRELRHVLAARELDHYFLDIYSADWTKQDAITDALSKNKVHATEAVYIGDSPEDANAAKAAGIQFIGRRSSRDLSELREPVFNDITGVQGYLANVFNAC